MRKKIKFDQYKFAILVYTIILIVMQLPWIVINGKSYNIYQTYNFVNKVGLSGLSDGVQSIWASMYENPEIMLPQMIKLEMISIILFMIICLSCVIMAFLKKDNKLNIAAFLSCFAFFYFNSTGFALIADTMFVYAFPALLEIVIGLEFLLGRALDAWEEATKKDKIRKKEEKQRIEEERRRLYFPGNYGKLFYKVVWKNFKYNWKDYLLFVICGTVTAALLFAEFGLQEMLSSAHSEEKFLVSQGVGQIVLDSILPIGLIGILLVVFVLIHYLKTRVRSYGMFITLGTRSKTLATMIAIEFVGNFIISIALGYLTGNGILHILRQIIHQFSNLELQPMGFAPYWKTFAGIIFIYVIGLMATREVYSDFSISISAVKKVLKEKIPGKYFKTILTISLLIVTFCVLQYAQLRNYEYIVILLICILGLFFVLRYGLALYLKKKSRSKKYLSSLLNLNQLYHKSKTNTGYLLALTVIHIFVLFYFSFQVISVTIAETPEELYPYDFMCIADESDNAFFGELQKKYEIEFTEYPMVRVSNVDKTQMREARSEPPIGQHIGISETTYHELKKALNAEYQAEPLNLSVDGKSIYVVHQQDKSIKAQPTDWYGLRAEPYIHIGQPPYYYSSFSPREVEKSFQKRQIAGEEIVSLTGCFRQGLLENLIVFSDEYFEEAQEAWRYTNKSTGQYIEDESLRIPGVTIHQGPTKLVLIKANENDLEKLEKEMNTFRSNHKYDEKFDSEVLSCYSKAIAVMDMKTERIMKIIVNSFIIVVFILSSIIMLSVKVVAEMDEKHRRSVFLESLGMRETQRKKLLQNELSIFYFVPCGLAVIISICFTIATFMARMYTLVDIANFGKGVIWLWISYLTLEWLLIWVLGKITIWKVEGRYERE